jgi:hypothetical protein
MIKSSGFTKTSHKYHDELMKAMAPYKRKELTTAEIRCKVEGVPSLREKADWIYPSDHCSNHTNKGACTCAMTNNAIFKQIRPGKYQVL